MATPPASLTAARLRNPHRGIEVRNYGRLSHLEESFARGRVEEIEYWIESGVVAEAMTGHARSRRVYTQSLMNHFAEHLFRSGLERGEWHARKNTILDTLWNLGAKDHTDRHADWLRCLIAHPLADVLIEQGHDPWKATSDQTLLARHPHERSAIENGLYLLCHRQINTQWRQHLEPLDQDAVVGALMERVGRHLKNAETINTVVGSRALAITFKGAWGAQTHSGFLPWRQWRDQLIARGAGAQLAEGDALFWLIQAAPFRPFRKSNAEDAIWAAQKAQATASGEEAGPFTRLKPLDDAALNTLMQRGVEQRALRWIKISDDWMRAIAPTLLIKGNSGIRESQRDEHWVKILDAPGGQAMARQLVRLLAESGQELPWTQAKSPPRWHTQPDRVELITYRGLRSLRRMAALVDLLEQPGVAGGVCDQWRADLARNTLRCTPLGDEVDDLAPGLTLEAEDPSWNMRGWTQGQHRHERLDARTAQNCAALPPGAGSLAPVGRAWRHAGARNPAP